MYSDFDVDVCEERHVVYRLLSSSTLEEKREEEDEEVEAVRWLQTVVL